MSKCHFILYGRLYCHLCDDMLQALLALQAQNENDTCRFTVEMIDIDVDAELVAKYDELVPVLLGSKNGEAPVQLCHYFLEPGQVQRFLSG